MAIEFGDPELTELTPKIVVLGVGGAGCNAVNNMIAADLQGVDFVVANTDAQSLANSKTDSRLQLGVEVTKGLGAGAKPQMGQAAAEESLSAIENLLEGAHMVFITAGMGGGTGTGAAPVIAKMAREKGILTVGVVTKPFQFEGGRRMKLADAGIAELSQHVDTLIIIPNQNLFRVANERTTFADAFAMADDVLLSGVRGVSDLMVVPGLINLDFADVRTVMTEMGKAMMGTGEAEGEQRAVEAASAAISNPLLEEASLRGAKGVIINVTGGMDMTLYEVDEAVNMVRELVDPEALIVFGSAFNNDLEGKLRVSVVATGIEGGSTRNLPEPQRQPAAEPQPAKAVVVEQAASPANTVEQAAQVAPDAVPSADVGRSEHVPQAAESADIAEVATPANDLASAETEFPHEPIVTDQTAENVANALEELEAKAREAQGDRVFVADKPMEPKARLSNLGSPDPARVAGYGEQAAASNTPPAAAASEVEIPTQPAPASGPDRDTEDEEPVRLTLFQRMTSGLRQPADQPIQRVVDEPPVTAVSTPAAVAPPKAVVVASETAEPAKSNEQLEIPSFLKRQQN